MRPGVDPTLVIFTTPWTAERARLGPFSLSLGLHLLIVTSVLVENYMRPPLELQIVPPEQLLADDRYELTWPVFPDDLPPVQPIEPPKPAPQPKAGDARPPRFRLPQQVTADDPNAASSRQMVWDQAPKVELTRDVRSPNFIEPQLSAVQRLRFEAVQAAQQAPARQALREQAPRVEAAPNQQLSPDLVQPAARLRYWTSDIQQAVPKSQALTPETAPRIEARTSAPEIAGLQPGPTLRYWTPEIAPATPGRQALSEAAPVVPASPGQGLDIGELQQPSRLRYWTAEQGADQPGKRALEVPAPQIQAGAGGAATLDIEQFQRLSRLRYQQQAEEDAGNPAAPARGALAAAAEVSPDLGPAGRAAAAQGAADLIQAQALASLGEIAPPGALAPGRAVVGVDPDPNAAPPPRGTRSGNFSAGPDGGATGTGSGTGAAEGADSSAVAGVRIPNLSVTPASPGAPSGLSDTRPPGGNNPPNADREALLRQFRDASFTPAPNLGVLAPERPPDPDFPFPGRAVYSLAVNMPNVNSYSGSWIIEFAEAKQGDAKQGDAKPGELSPPSPRLKVDPVYSREAIDERIEGDVVLHAIIRADGLVDHIKVIKRLDARLDESARVALSKWRFHPATKRGVPVDIETIVRIPFRLTGLKDIKR